MSALIPPNPGPDALPSGVIELRFDFTQRDAEEFARRFREAINKRGRWPGGPVALRAALRRRTRLRLASSRRIDKTCGWLCEHHCGPAAVLIWRTCGLWRR